MVEMTYSMCQNIQKLNGKEQKYNAENLEGEYG